MQNKIPVLIIGAGPTGLAMAIILHQQGIPFNIIDQEDNSFSNRPVIIQPRTLEILDDLGLANDVLKIGKKLQGISIFNHDGRISEIDTVKLPTLYPFLLSISRGAIKQIFLNYLSEQNINIGFEKKLMLIAQRTDFVSAHIKDKEGNYETILAEWLIACDGNQSTVCEQLHIQCTHNELRRFFVVADLQLKDDFPLDKSIVFLQQQGSFFLIPSENNKAMALIDDSTNEGLLNNENFRGERLRKIIQDRCPNLITIDKIIEISGFAVHEKMITEYKHNRTFFAGDAAHSFSPLAGAGLNIGIQDVYNLGWKLSSVIKKQSQLSILDTYQIERLPVAQDLLTSTNMLTHFISTKRPLSQPLQRFIVKIMSKHKKMAKKFFGFMRDLSIKYLDSPLTKEEQPSQEGPMAGERMLDGFLDHSRDEHLLNLIRGPKPSILFFTGILRDDRNDLLLKLINEYETKYKDIFNYMIVSVSPLENQNTNIKIINDHEQLIHRLYEVTLATLYFIRPDKYIGFRGRLSQQKILEEYLDNIYCLSHPQDEAKVA